MKAKIQAEIDIDLEELNLTPAALIALLKSKNSLNSGMAKGLIRYSLKSLTPEERAKFLQELLYHNETEAA